MNQKKQCFKLLAWLPAIMMMVIIYMFSAKPAVVSDGTSSPIANAILCVFEAMFGDIDSTKRFDFLQATNFVVRKIAHIMEYAILTVLISIPLRMHHIKNKSIFIIAFVTSVIYAGTDEFHQTFVEGRSGSLKDVGIDSIGVLLGSLFFYIAVKCYEKRKSKHVKRN